MVTKNLLMIPANSVAGILMFTIGLSVINLGSSGMSSNQMSSTTPTIAPNMPNEWSNNTTNVSQTQNKLEAHLPVSSLLENEKFQINLKYHLSVSCISELENYQKDLESRLDDARRFRGNNKENNYNLVTELSIGILKLSENLHQKQEALLKITQEYYKLNDKYMELEKSYSIEKQKMEKINNKLEILQLNIRDKENALDMEKKNNKILFDAKTLLYDELSTDNYIQKQVHTENIKSIENECQLNLTNKQQGIKILKNDILKNSPVELLNILLSIMKFNEDNVPNDLLEKRRRLLDNQYDENQTKAVNNIRKLFDDIALTTNYKSPNKYFCNKKISHYNSSICAMFSENLNSRTIIMEGFNLSIIPKDTFIDCKKVDFLDLSFNRLNYLESGTFNGLLLLKELWINHNYLTTIPKDIFNGLEKLEFLVLYGNRLTHLESGTFNGLLALNYFSIGKNNLTTLPKDIFNGLKKLETLTLYSNQLNYLESGTFDDLSQLKDLSIQDNHLTSLSRNIFNGLKQLETLYLNQNRLSSFESDTFNGLSNLKRLNLSENNLTTCSKQIFGLDNLISLDC